MTKQYDKNPRQTETRQASTVIAICSIIGLTICFVSAIVEKADVPLFLYAIFGGGVLGTDNVLKFVRAIFRIDR